MKIKKIFHILSLLSLLILPSCEDYWTGQEVVIEKLSITNGNYVGCRGDSVQLWALDQNGDTTTNVYWYSSNESVTVNAYGLMVLTGDSVSQQLDDWVSSAHVMAKSVADNVTSAPISVTSDNPSPLDQYVGTWLARSDNDTLGLTSPGYKYQKLVVNANGSWSGEATPNFGETTTASGFFIMDTTKWYGFNRNDSTWANMTWITTSEAGNDTAVVSLQADGWFYPKRNGAGNYTQRAYYNALCEISDTLNNDYAPGYPFLGSKAVRQ